MLESHKSLINISKTRTMAKYIRDINEFIILAKTCNYQEAAVDIEPRVDMSIYMHYLKKGPRSAAASLFLDYIRSVLKTCM